MLFRVPDNGPVRTGFVLKEQDLFYRISIANQLDSVLIPCGKDCFEKVIEGQRTTDVITHRLKCYLQRAVESDTFNEVNKWSACRY